MRDGSIATTTVSGGVSSLNPAGSAHLTRGDVLVNPERRHVDFEMLGNPARRSGDLELVRDDVHHGARVPNALGDADGNDCEPRVDRLVRRNALQVGVDDAARNGMALNLADEHRLNLAAAGQRDDRVASRAMNQFVERVRVEREMLGNDAVPVEHRGEFTGRAQAL